MNAEGLSVIFRISSLAPMNFSGRSPLLLLLFLLLIPAACQRRISPEEKSALGQSCELFAGARQFAKAHPLARRVLEFAPHDNGAWARLAQAQWDSRDLTGAAPNTGRLAGRGEANVRQI